jgi:hypothetical protein
VQHFQLHTIDLEIFLVLSDDLRRQVIGRGRASAAASNGRFLLLLVPLMRDDRNTGRERSQAIDVIAVGSG